MEAIESDTSAVRRRLTRDERRAQLLDAAEQAFAQRGFGSTSFEDIAACAGVTRPLLYGYFDSVDEIYGECYRTARNDMQEHVIEAVAAARPEPEERLRAGLTAYFDHVRGHPRRFALLYGPGPGAGPLAQELAALRYQTAEQLATLFAAAVPDMSASDAVGYAHIASGAAEQLAKWWSHHPDIELEAIVGLVMNSLWRGLQSTLGLQPGQ